MRVLIESEFKRDAEALLYQNQIFLSHHLFIGEWKFRKKLKQVVYVCKDTEINLKIKFILQKSEN